MVGRFLSVSLHKELMLMADARSAVQFLSSPQLLSRV